MSEIVSDVKVFFEDNIALKPFSDEQSEEYNRAFLEFLHDSYDEETINENLEDIQNYIRGYFQDIGRVLFKYNFERGMFFKLYTYEINPIYSKHFNALVEILNNNKEKIQYPYLERNDQIAILEDINRLMENEISNTSEIGDKKELFRASIRKALELSDRDIILFFKK